MDLLFAQHGSLSFSIESDNILVIQGIGPWNKETLTDISEEQLSLIATLYDKPWGVLAIMYGDPIHTPDASEFLSEVVKLDKQRGRKTTAIVIQDCDIPRFAKQHIGEIYQKADESFQFFDDTELALSWLNQKLAS